MFCFSNQKKEVCYSDFSCLSITRAAVIQLGTCGPYFVVRTWGCKRSKPGPKYIRCCPPYSGSVWCLIWAEQGKVVSTSWTAAWAVQENTRIFICRCLAAAWWILSSSSGRWSNVKLQSACRPCLNILYLFISTVEAPDHRGGRQRWSTGYVGDV